MHNVNVESASRGIQIDTIAGVVRRNCRCWYNLWKATMSTAIVDTADRMAASRKSD